MELDYNPLVILINKVRPYWIAFSIGSCISLVLIVLIAYSGHKFIKGVITTIEFMYGLWRLYAVVGLTFGSLVFILNVIRYLDDKELGYVQWLIIPLFYFPILCVITLFLYKRIIDKKITDLYISFLLV